MTPDTLDFRLFHSCVLCRQSSLPELAQQAAQLREEHGLPASPGHLGVAAHICNTSLASASVSQRARFQIEFVFRDAKGSMGLSHCQARNAKALEFKALEFHWNAAFCALNVAKWQETQRCEKHSETRLSFAKTPSGACC
jgi:hypothetical protein